jgi:hypothetical protein
MTIDLEELKRLAQEARAPAGKHGFIGPELQGARDAFRAVANPTAVLALIERVEEAERHAAFLTDWSQATTEVVCGERPKGVMVATTLEAVRALKARVSKLEALARKGLEAYHKGSGRPAAQHVDNSAECSHAACREWAAALEDGK